MMKTKQAKNQNHPLPKLPLRTTKAKTYPMWSTWEQEIQNEGRILPDQTNSFRF